MLNKLFEGLKTVATYVVVCTVAIAIVLGVETGLGIIIDAGHDYIESITPINYEEKMDTNLKATLVEIKALTHFEGNVEAAIGTEICDRVLVDKYYEALKETDPLLIKYIKCPNLMNK